MRAREAQALQAGLWPKPVLGIETEDLSEKVFQTVSRQVEIGEVSPVEKQRARVPLSQARFRLRRAEEARAAARKTLSGALGPLGHDGLQGGGGDIRVGRSGPSLDAVKAAVARNPTLARQQDEIEQANAVLSLEKRDRFPVPTLTVSRQRFGGHTGSDRTAFKAGISLPLPLYDRNQGAVQRARYRLKRAQWREYERERIQKSELRGVLALMGIWRDKCSDE